MDRTELGVAVVLVVVLVGGVGYAYVTGMGPLEENPTAGLEEPPETESTYSFGEVSETAGGGSVDDGKNDDVDTDDGAREDTNDAEAVGDGNTEQGTDQKDKTDVSDKEVESPDSEADTDDKTDDEADTESNDVGGDEAGSDDDGERGGDRDNNAGGDGGGAGEETDDRGADSDSDSRVTTALQANTERSGPPFVPELENMEECGETCREATVALQNNMNVDAENVVVYVRLHAGDSTDSEDVVWGENRNIGTLEPGEVYRETETVDLTPQQANKVRETDGVVTAKATIESDQATATFVERDNVE
jgi:hypothetical protein